MGRAGVALHLDQVVHRLARCIGASLAIVLVLGLASATAQAPTAKALVWSDQIYMNVFNDVYATGEAMGHLGGDLGRLEVTRDRGKTWSRLPIPTHERITWVYGVETGQLAASTGRAYFLSFDFGASWNLTSLDADETFRFVAFTPGVPDSAWVVTHFAGKGWNDEGGSVRLQVTGDGGKSWPVATSLDFVPGYLRPVDSLRAWAFAGTKAFLTTNGGTSWVEMADLYLLPGENVARSVLLGTSLLVASNMGRLWTVDLAGGLTVLPSVGVQRLFSIAAFADGSGYVIDGTARIWTSDRIGSAPWRVAAQIDQSLSQAWPWPDGTYLVRTTGGLVMVLSPPWTEKSEVFDVAGKPVHAAVALNGRAIVSTDQGELLASTDGGASWEETFDPPVGAVTTPSIDALTMSPGLFALAINSLGEVLLSRDSGRHWATRAQLPTDEVAIGATLMSDEFALITTRRGSVPLQSYHSYRLALSDGALMPVTATAYFTLVSSVSPNLVRAVSAEGDVLESTDQGFSWPRVVAGPSLPGIADPAVPIAGLKLMWWLDDANGWVVAASGDLFRTRDGGGSFRPVKFSEPSEIDVSSVWFADRDNGLIYGTLLVEGDRWSEYSAVTSDGGETWTARGELGSAAAGELAIARDGTAVFTNATGLVHATELATATLDATLTQAVDGKLSFVLDQAMAAQAQGGITDVRLAVRVGEAGSWVDIPIDPATLLEGDKESSFTWNPGDTDDALEVSPGAHLAIRALVTTANGVTSTVAFPPVTYLGWYAANRDFINQLLMVAAAVLAVVIALGIVYLAAPARMVSISTAQDSIADAVAKVGPLMFLHPLIRQLILAGVVGRLARSNRVARHWARRYVDGKAHFHQLNERVMGDLLKKPEIVDAWVARRFDAVRVHLARQKQLLGAANYVVLPVKVKQGGGWASIAQTSSKELRRYFAADRLAFGIVGDGGVGKTTLACQIGLWAMHRSAEQRLVPDATALAIVVRGNVPDVIGAVRQELMKAYADADRKGTDLSIVGAALDQRRLLVIFDGLSEVPAETQAKVGSLFAESPIKLLVVTARRSYPQIVDNWVEAAPQQVSPSTVNHFVSQYIRDRSDSGLSGPEGSTLPPPSVDQELDISRQVANLVERRFGAAVVPPVFVVLFIETVLASRGGDVRAAPSSLPETVQRYVRTLRSPLTEALGIETFVDGVTALAELSLAGNFIPKEFGRDAAIKALEARSPGRDGDQMLKAIVEAKLLVDRLGSGGVSFTFRLDPIAEYLAAAAVAKEIDADGSWAEIHARISNKGQGGSVALGFATSLHETLTSVPVPPSRQDMVRALEQILTARALGALGRPGDAGVVVRAGEDAAQ